MSENLRKYLSEIPIMADILAHELAMDHGTATNTEEQRFHLESQQHMVAKRVKDEKQLYATMYYPEQEQTCPICKEVLKGYYWELNNPVTTKAACVSFKVLHAFVHHEQSFITELMENVTGVKVGEMRMVLDLGAIASVMKGSNVDVALIAECEQAVLLQQRALTAAGPLAASGGGH